MPDENKYSIEETLDIFMYSNEILDKLQKHKSDDGTIDTKEIASTFITTIPAGIRAYAGSSKVDDEMKDLNKEEMMQLAKEGSKLAKKLMSLFFEKKEEEEEKPQENESPE